MIERRRFDPWSRNGGAVAFGFLLIFVIWPVGMTLFALFKGWL
jgi:hypothetical protein